MYESNLINSLTLFSISGDFMDVYHLMLRADDTALVQSTVFTIRILEINKS